LLAATLRRRHRLSWMGALGLVATVTISVVVGGALLVLRTDPTRYPDLETALWWAVSTVTTVGYGDVVPASTAGRLLAAVLMFIGIGSFAFLTAIAASAIVVGEVGKEERVIEAEERVIEAEEREIEREQRAVLVRLDALDARLDRIEASLRQR
jgi:voltage-gated potassium channel